MSLPTYTFEHTPLIDGYYVRVLIRQYVAPSNPAHSKLSYQVNDEPEVFVPYRDIQSLEVKDRVDQWMKLAAEWMSLRKTGSKSNPAF